MWYLIWKSCFSVCFTVTKVIKLLFKVWSQIDLFFFCSNICFSSVNSGLALSEIAGPFSAADVSGNCSGGPLKEPLLWVISYALMAVCAFVLIILLLLLVLPCRRRQHSGEITDESSLVRHRIKWLRGKEQGDRINRQGGNLQGPSTAEGMRLTLDSHQTGTLSSECLTDSRLNSSLFPVEVETDKSVTSEGNIYP